MIRPFRSAALARVPLLACLLIAAALFAPPARADVGIPPWSVPGSPPNPGEQPTQVQMVSEDVLLVIEAHDDPDVLHGYGGDLAANHLIGHVDATFQMRNQGAETEAFDVWFPLWASKYDYDIAPVQNFAAWVDGVPAEITTYYGPGDVDGPIETLTPWATWFMTFPPGQTVEIGVQYDVFPAGDEPYGTFHYILETGADWQGVIEEATVTYRLPYPVNEINTALQPESRSLYASTGPNPPDPAVSGSDVVWRFTDLEPTAEDNVQLTVMDPAVWLEIEAAQQAADATLDVVEDQIRLAEALAAGLDIYKTLHPQASSLDLAKQAVDAYQRAVLLNPDVVTVENLTDYFRLMYFKNRYEVDRMTYPADDLLWLLWRKMQTTADTPPVFDYLQLLYYEIDTRYYDHPEDSPTPPDAFLAVVDRAVELDPEKSGWFEYWQALYDARGPIQAPTLALSPTPEPTSPPSAVDASPAPTVTPAANRGVCPAALPLALGVVGAGWWLGVRRRIRSPRDLRL